MFVLKFPFVEHYIVVITHASYIMFPLVFDLNIERIVFILMSTSLKFYFQSCVHLHWSVIYAGKQHHEQWIMVLNSIDSSICS